MALLILPLARVIAQSNESQTSTFSARPAPEATPPWQASLNACVGAGTLSQRSVQSAIEAVAFAGASPHAASEGNASASVGIELNTVGPRLSPAGQALAIQLAGEALRTVDFSQSADTEAGRVAFVLAVHALDTMSKRPSKADWEAGIIDAMLYAVGACIASLRALADASQARHAVPSAAPAACAPPILECYGLELMLQAIQFVGVVYGAATPLELDQFVAQLGGYVDVLRRLLAANTCGCDAHVSSLRCCSAPPAASSPGYGDLLRNICSPDLVHFKRARVNTSSLVRTHDLHTAAFWISR
jgi:hypothetical protein